MAFAGQGKTNWGDAAEDDFEDGPGPGPLPEREVTVADGVTKTVEWSYDENKKKVKTTRRTRTVERRTRVHVKVEQRRKWEKFGACRGVEGPEKGITSVGEAVRLDLTPKMYCKKEGPSEDIQITKSGGSGGNIVVCRLCKGDHWTQKCPLKDQLRDRLPDGESAPGGPDVGGPAAANTSGKYIPPSLRDGQGGRKSIDAARAARQQEEELCALRVTNLSEEADERDITILFSRYGRINRVYLVRDRETDRSRGFAFVHFVERSDAISAKDALDGYPYDHQILDVDWAKPRNY